MYRLENKSYYKLPLPLVNKFSPATGYNPMIFRLRAYLSGQTERAWAAPSDFASLEQLFETNPTTIKWYSTAKKDLIEIQQKAKVLKQNTADKAFYADAVAYAAGLSAALLFDFPNNTVLVFALLNYMIDAPFDSNDKLQDAFGQDGYEFFKQNLPQTFVIWARIRSDKDLSQEEKDTFDHYGICLFDFILTRVVFSIWNTSDKQLQKFLLTQLLCYVKWLYKHNIFLPKDMQQRIFDLTKLFKKH